MSEVEESFIDFMIRGCDKITYKILICTKRQNLLKRHSFHKIIHVYEIEMLTLNLGFKPQFKIKLCL